MRVNFEINVKQYILKNYGGQFVGIRWRVLRPIRDSELEWLINYGYKRLDEFGGNVCELVVNKAYFTQV